MVIVKVLMVKGWIGLFVFLIIGILFFVELFNYYGGSFIGLDGLSIIIVIVV